MSFVMYVQNMYALKQTISQLEAVNNELQEQTRSAAARYDEAQQRRDLAESKLAELEHSR
jgi:hypothetical protein